MLLRTSDLLGCEVRAQDGDAGKVADLHFEEGTWIIRYLMVETGGFFVRDDILVPTQLVRVADLEQKRVEIDLTKAKLEQAPEVNLSGNMKRADERGYLSYLALPMYWGGLGSISGPMAAPAPQAGVDTPTVDPDRQDDDGDSDIRSLNARRNSTVYARSESIGKVDDFIFESDSWTIRYMVVDTGTWWPGKRVVVAPSWVESVGIEDNSVRVDLDADLIKSGPGLDPHDTITREFEQALHSHYKRQAYWG